MECFGIALSIRSCLVSTPWPLARRWEQRIWSRTATDPLLLVRSIAMRLPCNFDCASSYSSPPWVVGPRWSCSHPPELIAVVWRHRARSYPPPRHRCIKMVSPHFPSHAPWARRGSLGLVPAPSSCLVGRAAGDGCSARMRLGRCAAFASPGATDPGP
jgi:hypothetical protein